MARRLTAADRDDTKAEATYTVRQRGTTYEISGGIEIAFRAPKDWKWLLLAPAGALLGYIIPAVVMRNGSIHQRVGFEIIGVLIGLIAGLVVGALVARRIRSIIGVDRQTDREFVADFTRRDQGREFALSGDPAIDGCVLHVEKREAYITSRGDDAIAEVFVESIPAANTTGIAAVLVLGPIIGSLVSTANRANQKSLIINGEMHDAGVSARFVRMPNEKVGQLRVRGVTRRELIPPALLLSMMAMVTACDRESQ